MLVAVNKQLRALPEHLQVSAEAVLAQELARDFDAGYRTTSSRLVKVLEQLRKLAEPPKASGKPGVPVEEEPEPDELDDLARARAARLAEAAGVVSRLGDDERRRGGRRAR